MTLGAFAIEYYVVGGGVDRARVMAFSTTIFAQNVHAFNVRSNKYSVFELGLLSNPYLVMAFCIVVLSELVIIYAPIFQPIFKTVPLTLSDWAIVVSLGLIPLLIVESVKLVRRLLGRR